MEKQQGGENLQGPKPETPRLVFPIAGKEVNIADALSSDPARSKGLNYRDIADKAGAAGSPEKFKPGDRYALDWLKMFQESHLTGNQYKEAMPRFFEWAAKPEGGFENGLLAVADQIFDTTCQEMGLSEGYRIYGPYHPVWANTSAEKRAAFYGRAYGQLQGFKKYVWDDPAQAAKKEI